MRSEPKLTVYMINKLNYFLEKGEMDNLLTFLKRLTAKEREKIIPELEKKRRDEYKWNFESNPVISRKIEMLEICFFVCMDESRIRNLPRYDLPEDEVIDSILKWYRPIWLSDYFNKVKTLPYKYVMKWMKEGYLKPEKPLIAKSLSSALWVKEPNKVSGYYSIEALEKYPETLREHIWYLFEYNSDIVFYDEHSGVENAKDEHIWVNAFLKYTANGSIQRSTLLKKCLLAITKKVNPNSLTWYASLFVALKPDTREVLSFQNELLDLFSGGKSEKELLEILRNEMAALFLSKDDSIKQHIATVFNRYGDKDSFNIKESLQPYAKNIPSNIKSLLSSWL